VGVLYLPLQPLSSNSKAAASPPLHLVNRLEPPCCLAFRLLRLHQLGRVLLCSPGRCSVLADAGFHSGGLSMPVQGIVRRLVEGLLSADEAQTGRRRTLG